MRRWIGLIGVALLSGCAAESPFVGTWLPTDPAALQQAFAQMQSMLASSGDEPVNWQMAHDLARQQASVEGDPSLTAAQTR